MKDNNVVLLLLSLFTMIIVLSPTLSGDITEGKMVVSEDSSSGNVQLAYDSHSYIVITKNSDFIDQGWPGSGTEEDPYIIENLDIRWSTCISISDTTVHFTIRNCYLWSYSTMRQDGIYLYNVDHATIEGCTILDKIHGVYSDGTTLDSSINCTVSNNTIGVFVPCSNGIYLQHSEGCVISNNTILDSSYYGIYLEQSEFCEVYDNTVDGPSNGWTGIYANDFSLNSTIVNNTVYDSRYGFRSSGSSFTHAANNIIKGSSTAGISINSYGCTLVNNTVYDVVQYGILVTAQHCTIHNNTLRNAAVSFGQGNSWGYDVSGNTVNDKPLGYFVSHSNTSVDGYLYGQVILDKCTNVTIIGGIFFNTTGIDIGFSTDCHIKDTLILNALDHGLYLYSSDGCSIVNCTILGCNTRGLYLCSSYNCSIKESTFCNMLYGIQADVATECRFSNNIINTSTHGFWLYRLYNSSLEKNHVHDNIEFGIYLYSSFNVSIIGNDIHNNGYYDWPEPDTGGIGIESTDECHIVNNTVHDNPEVGIILSSDDSLFIGNNIERNTWGLYLVSSTSCVSNINIISDNTYGLYIETSANYSSTFDIITNNYRGILFDSSADCIVKNCTVSLNTDYGLYILDSPCTIICNTSVSNSIYGLYFTKSENCIIDSNHIYWNQYGIFNSSSCLVSNNDIFENIYGVYLDYATDCNFTSNMFRDNTDHGILLVYSTHCTLIDNQFIGTSVVIKGLTLQYWNHTLIDNFVVGGLIGYFFEISGTIVDCSSFGQILVAGCVDTTFVNGEFHNTSWGIQMALCDSCVVTDCIIIENRWGGVLFYYSANCSLKDSSVYGNTGDGVVMESPTYGTLMHNDIYSNGGFGIYIRWGGGTSVLENVIYDNQEYNLRIYHSTNTIVMRNWINGSYYGIAVEYYSNDCSIVNNTVQGAEYVIFLSESNDCIVSNNTATLGYIGIYVSYSTTCEVLGNNAHDCVVGILFTYSDFCQAYDNTIYSNTVGISIAYSNNCSLFSNIVYENSGHGVQIHSFSANCTFENNVVFNNSGTGVYLSSSDNCVLGNNTISSNYFGIQVGGCSNTNILYNVVNASLSIGIYLQDDSYDCRIFGNKIGQSGSNNALDDGSLNLWDDNIDFGNYWDDYFGLGTYDIPGTAGSIDRYPLSLIDFTPPNIDSPINITFEDGSTGYSIIWNPSDENPDSYSVFMNGSQIKFGPWNGSEIAISLDGLEVGMFNFTVVVYDIIGNVASDTIFVTVVDTTSPLVDQPSNQIYEDGSIGNQIEWTVSDLNPDEYAVFGNGTTITWTPWVSGQILVTIDGLVPGIYNFTIIVTDYCGNWATCTVIVTVIDTTAPNLSQPSDLLYEQGSIGNEVVWTITDRNPGQYRISGNATIVEWSPWTDGSIHVPVDGLSVGVYNCTITVVDEYENLISHTVWVNVLDTTSPTVSSPGDIVYEVGTFGHTIVWQASDLNPYRHDIFRGGHLVSSSDWVGSDITYPIDGLGVGSYNVTIEIYDTSGNSIVDTVIVTVVSTATITTTTSTTFNETTTTNDNSFTIVILLGLTGAIVVVLIILFQKKLPRPR